MFRLLIYYIILIGYMVCRDGTIEAVRICDVYNAQKQSCRSYEYCDHGRCLCKPEYVQVGDDCVPEKPLEVTSQASPLSNDPPDKNGAHVAVAIIIPFTLIVMVAGLFLVVRRYNLISWARTKFNQRQTPYDEVMIGQDDDDSPLPGI